MKPFVAFKWLAAALPAAAMIFAAYTAHAADWPMWRYDTARSAEWPGELPEELHLQWVRELPAPMRAWHPQRDDRQKLDFDVSFAPVAAEGLLFVPSNSTDSVAAYRLSDGGEVWRFFADGPVRLAPAYSEGRLFFTADDGHLYCVDASDGRLLWKFRGGPSDHRLLGNERIINFWAARGAPLVADGKVYFSAGLWPLHGVFIYALDAASGEVAWVNDTTSSEFVRVPRGSVYGGLVPQGYFAVADSFPEEARNRYGRPLEGDYLVVSGGRAGPAFLDRSTGEIAADIFDTTGLLRRKHEGGYAVHGVFGLGIGKIRNDMLHERLEAVSGQLDGPAFYKLAASGRFVVVTEAGTIYCFGPGPTEAVRYEHQQEALAGGAGPWPELARNLLGRLGETEGYALVLGAGSGDLTRELLRRSNLHVVVAEEDADRVQALREELVGAGMYGRRAAVIEADPAAFSVQPYLFSIVVAEDAQAAGLAEGGTDVVRGVLELLRPYGGLAWLGGDAASLVALAEAADAAAVDQVSLEPRKVANGLLARRSGPLAKAGQWTHQHHDGANTLLSHDDRVKLPLGVLWFGGPTNRNILGKHSRGPRPQVVAGRQVFIGVNTIAARCVYTGRELWEREFRGIGSAFDTTANLPGTSYIGSPFVSLPDSVYLRYGGQVHRMDPASGESLATFALPGRPVGEIYDHDDATDWGHVSVHGEHLIVTAEPHLFEGQRLGGSASHTAASSRRLAVLDRFSGRTLWEREAQIGFRHNAIASSNGVLYVIDGLPEQHLELLIRRGKEFGEPASMAAIAIATGEEIWRTSERVFGTYLLYSAEHDILVEGGNYDVRHLDDGRGNPEDEPKSALARRGATGEILWENERFLLPAAVRGDMLISASRFHRRAVSLLTGETWQRVQPHTGRANRWTYAKSKNCDSLNASKHLLLFRTTYAGFYDLEHDSGIGFFSGFRSGCTANMLAADGVLNSLDYTRRCNCSYPHQTSLAMIHMPGDPNIEFWTRGSAALPNPEGHGINFGAPGRRVDVAGTGLVWQHREGTHGRHPSAIKDNGGAIPWVLASAREMENGDAVTIGEVRPGTYAVRLHFAELNGNVQQGQRVFSIQVNGQEVANGFDIAAAAGGAFRGVVKETETVAGDNIEIQLIQADGSELPPVINGIELVARD